MKVAVFFLACVLVGVLAEPCDKPADCHHMTCEAGWTAACQHDTCTCAYAGHPCQTQQDCTGGCEGDGVMHCVDNHCRCL